MATNGSKRAPLVADKRYPKTSSSRKTTKKTKGSTTGKGGGRRKPPAPRKSPKRRGPWPLAVLRWLFRLILRFFVAGAVAVTVIIALFVFYTSTTVPPLDELLDGRARGSVTLLDRDGDTFAWRGDQFGGQISADTVSADLKNAIVATEDKRFYRHFGVSPRGIASAIRINLSEGRGPLSGHGGSTLTQQVAKLLCFGVPYDPSSGMSETEYEAGCRTDSLWRKAQEAVYAMALEVKYSKDDILTIYLNRAYLGAGNYGFEAATQRYFGHSAAQATPGEAAIMAGSLTAPSRYAPTTNFDRSWDRALTVLRLMEDQGYLTRGEADAARAMPPVLAAGAEEQMGEYFADWVMASGPSFLTRDTTEDVIIRTTFDPRIQKAAEEALAWIFENKVREGSQAQAAIVVMDADGAVRAMVGGRDLERADYFNRAVQAQRQTGSAFKPFIYAAALDMGYSYNDTIVDEPFCMNIPGSGEWCPQNYSRQHYGTVTLTQALRDSLNIPAVKLSEAVGRDNVRTVASMFGIESDLADGPALALGVSETTLLQMTGAYAGILNGGSSVRPYGLVDLRLVGDSQPLMEQAGGIGERVISPNADAQLVYMMNKVINEGSGQRAKLPDREAAGKTGTTQSARDAWFVGFTADYVAGVWMGYDDNTPLTGVTGGGLPAETWHEVMTRVHEGLPARPLPMIHPSPSETGTQVGTPRQVDPGEGLIDVLRSIFGLGN